MAAFDLAPYVSVVTGRALRRVTATGDAPLCSVELDLQRRAVVLHVHDFSWSTVSHVRDTALDLADRPGMLVEVDLTGMTETEHSVVWFAGLIAMRRLLSIRSCVLRVVHPPEHLETALGRLGLLSAPVAAAGAPQRDRSTADRAEEERPGPGPTRD